MQARKLLHTLFTKTLSFMHAKRVSALLDAVESLLIGKRLSLTYLARNLQCQIKERHCIRKIDRLLGNTKLHVEIKSCYHSHAIMLLNNISQPIISVDWAATDKRKDWHILRATLNIQGRGHVIYQEVHPQCKSNSRKIQHAFLDKLKSMMPEKCRPIIVADAGFRFPWFDKIKRLGFDFVGRLRQRVIYRPSDSTTWHENCLDLYRKATTKAAYLGEMFFTRQSALPCNVVLYRKQKSNRKHMNRSGKRTDNNASNRCARCQRDPWLLVTSLEINSIIRAEKIVSIYAKRMHIEEDFRDIKSHRYGFGLRYSLTNQAKRLEVLLLIAALACLICWLISLSARKKNLHYDYQSNSIKSRNVLSCIYLGCQLVRRNASFDLEEIYDAFDTLQKLVREVTLC